MANFIFVEQDDIHYFIARAFFYRNRVVLLSEFDFPH